MSVGGVAWAEGAQIAEERRHGLAVETEARKDGLVDETRVGS